MPTTPVISVTTTFAALSTCTSYVIASPSTSDAGAHENTGCSDGTVLLFDGLFSTGTVGGALRTNAGTPEGDIGRLVREVEVMDAAGKIRRLNRDDIRFAYRHSSVSGQIVLSVDLQLRAGNKNDILAAIDRLLKRRAERQPLGTKNCGSVFKNPPGDHAARLIDAAGLKGFRVGGAQVSPKHANFIENVDHATAADVHTLIDALRSAVRQRFGIELELEVWTVGE